MSDKYELLYAGGIEAGFERPTVAANLKRLFKANDEQIEKMFSGRPVLLKNNLEAEAAAQYKRALQAQGATVAVRRMGSRDPQATSKSAAPDAPDAPVQRADPAAQTARPATYRDGPEGKLAGERTDDILSGLDWNTLPAGAALADQSKEAVPPVAVNTNWNLAPAGSDLGQLREDKPPVQPDISRLKLVDPD